MDPILVLANSSVGCIGICASMVDRHIYVSIVLLIYYCLVPLL